MTGRLFGAEVDDASAGSSPLEITVLVRDLGPEPERHDGRGGPWCRYQAEMPAFPVLRERGTSAWEAVNRLIGAHRALLERRWSS